MKIYSIYNAPLVSKVSFDVVVDAESRERAIQKAVSFFTSKMEDSGEYGRGYHQVVLGIYDEETDEEVYEEIELNLFADRPIDAVKEWGTR